MTKYMEANKKTRSGRDGTEEVLVVAGKYSASTVFNRAKAWQLVVAAYANKIAVQLEDLQQQRQQQKLRGGAGSDVEAALAECTKQHAYATIRLNAAGHILRAADARKKSEQRQKSSMACKAEKQRYVPHTTLVKGMEEWRRTLDMSGRVQYAQQVQELGEWLVVALHTFLPPLRREMYIALDVHDVEWDTDLDTWCIMVGHFFKTSKTAAIDRVMVVEKLVEPMAIYLRHRHVLNQRVDAAPQHSADANRALFVNTQRRRHSGTSMSGVFRHFGGKHLGIAAFGPHICRDIFATWYVTSNPVLRGHNVQALAAQMATSVEMLDKHYLHLRGRANAKRILAILEGRDDEVDAALTFGAHEAGQRTMSVAAYKEIRRAAAAAAGARRALEQLHVVARFTVTARARRGTKRKARDVGTAEGKRNEAKAPSLRADVGTAEGKQNEAKAPSLLAFMRKCHADGGGGQQRQTVTAMDVVRYKWSYGARPGVAALNAVSNTPVEHGCAFMKPGAGKQLYSAQANALANFKLRGHTAATGLAFMKQVAQVSTQHELAAIPNIAPMLVLAMSMRDVCEACVPLVRRCVVA